MLPADKREFLRISQAVGMGFLIMGVIGYIVKLSKYTSCPLPHAIAVAQQEHGYAFSFLVSYGSAEN